jgi:hypothetical protein
MDMSQDFPEVIDIAKMPKNTDHKPQYKNINKHHKPKLTQNISSGKPLVVKLKSNFEENLVYLSSYITDMMNGIIGIQLGDNKHSVKHCSYKLHCDKIWQGAHNFSHSTAAWLLIDLLKKIYIVEPVSAPISYSETEHPKTLDQLWESIEDDDNYSKLYYHHHPDELPFTVVVERINFTKETIPPNIKHIFEDILPKFFANITNIPRIGTTSLVCDRFCQGPFCYRTLLSGDNKSCMSLHSDEVSLLTMIVRLFTKYNKIYKKNLPNPLQNKTVLKKNKKEYEQKIDEVKKENKFDILSLVDQ